MGQQPTPAPPKKPVSFAAKPAAAPSTTSAPSPTSAPSISTEKLVYFHCSAPRMGFQYHPTVGGYPVRASFENHFLITSSPAIIEYVRREFVARHNLVFTVKEVTAKEYEESLVIKEANPPAYAEGAEAPAVPKSAFTVGPVGSVQKP